MAQHTGGAKMDKVEKKIEKKAPHGVTITVIQEELKCLK